MRTRRLDRWNRALAAASLAIFASATGASCGGDAHGGGGGKACATPCDAKTEVCSHDACVPRTTCATDEDCQNDTRCDPAAGCLPWEEHRPAHDPGCSSVSVPGVLQAKLRCEFSKAPAGDPFPGHVDVQGTPIVVNFNHPASLGPPSIAASFTATVPGDYTEELGVIRVLRGSDCTLEANLGGTDLDGDGALDWTVSSASLAAGDLDGDGAAEIVAYGADGSTLAFTRKSGVWRLLWKAPYPAGAPWSPCNGSRHRCSLGWAGPSIYDLDDDGKPEVVREGVVFGFDGGLRSPAPPDYASYGSGLFSVAANLDQDPEIELTNGQYIWAWRHGAWVKETGFPGSSGSAPGHVAIADFGAFGAGVPARNPEIVVVHNNAVAIYAITGELAQPPIPVPGAGGGGPPTIADIDGDGLPEIAIAGQAFYTVYDLDCGPSPRPGGACKAGPCDFKGPGVTCPAGGYIAWSRASQDKTSNVTGSSVFDFEGDGTSEVIYGDECFTRVYNGATGEVIASQYRSSCTWYENPVVADVDGNYRADLVTPSNKACAPDGKDAIQCAMLDENGVDSLFAGLHCKRSTDCASGVCDAGLCRCTKGAECCREGDDAACLEAGYACAPPPKGTPGTGNTCRAAHPHGLSGIRVYADANDRWVRSRAIWNQHPYSITHINEDGTVPMTSTWKNNWDDPKLNNFRENVPGSENRAATGDATVGPSDRFTCSAAGVDLSAPVCNRGADPIGAGLSVGFYAAGAKACGARTAMALLPDACEIVRCTWPTPPTAQAVDIDVIANDDKAYVECKGGNDHGTIRGVVCKPGG